MPGPVRESPPEPVPRRRGGRLVGVIDALLAPDLGAQRRAPVREDAHAVRRGDDLVEGFYQLVVGEVVVDVLADVEGGDHVERQSGDDSQRPKSDDGAVERVAVAVTVQRHDRTTGHHHLQRAHRRREAAVALARAVSSGRDRPGHRDVRQRPEVGQCPALIVQRPRHLAVPHAGSDRGASLVRVDLEQVGQSRDGDLVAVGVREPVEGVTGAERPDAAGDREQLLKLDDRCGAVMSGGAIDDVARPVRAPRRCSRHRDRAIRTS